jgi:hypothetical protein
MSKLTDYSKFDHLDSDSDDDEPEQAQSSLSKSVATDTAAPTNVNPNENENTGTVAPTTSSASPTTSIMQQHPTLPQRYIYLHHGAAAVYEWEQSLTEVIMYVPAPDFLLQYPKRIVCTIASNHLRLGQRPPPQQPQVSEQQQQQQYFLDEDTWQTVNVKESTWCIEDDTYIVIYLQKANKGIVWEAALKGRQQEGLDVSPFATLDPSQLQDVQQQLMRERFQEEHPGMDFSDAKFNGSAPDPRTFMGGVQHN